MEEFCKVIIAMKYRSLSKKKFRLNAAETAAVWNNWIIAQPFSKENRVFFGKRFPH